MPRGKKKCPKCEAQVGPRLAVCACGHHFTFKQGKAPKVKRKALKLTEPAEPGELDILARSPGFSTKNPSMTIAVSNRDEIKFFMAQLQECYRKSDHHGGCFTTFLQYKRILHADNPKRHRVVDGVLQVDVCLTIEKKV